MHPILRRGFNLVELLVVIAIISLLLLLLLPALNTARELGRRSQCINNQRNLVVALMSYNSAQNAFPNAVALCDSRAYNSLGREADVSCMGPNWALAILGQIEEDVAYDSMVECLRGRWHVTDDCAAAEGAIGRTTPSYMVCPSAPVARKPHAAVRTQLENLAKGNYAACLGSEHYRTAIEGDRRIYHEKDDPFQVGVIAVHVIDDAARLIDLTRRGEISGEWKMAHGQGTPVHKIKDGTSHTVLLSELLAWDGVDQAASSSIDIRGTWTSASMGASTYTHKYGPNSSMNDRINACDRRLDRNHPLHCEQMPATGPDSAETWASARSAHNDGVVAALADGSVHFYSNDIHLPVWQALASRAGND